LSASFDYDFWNTVVPQVSDRQEPVRSAIIAFSGLHESFEKSHSNTDTIYHTDEDKLLALQQYNKAVRQTAQLLDMKDPTSCRGGVDILSTFRLLGTDSGQLYFLNKPPYWRLEDDSILPECCEQYPHFIRHIVRPRTLETILRPNCRPNNVYG
jgi:hypothetical protein